MGRRRTIDRNAILQAAERVVHRSGAARLTLDAVAAEAGISKAIATLRDGPGLAKMSLETRIDHPHEG